MKAVFLAGMFLTCNHAASSDVQPVIQEALDQRTVAIAISVRCDGGPLSSVPLGVNLERQFWWGETDAHGSVQIDVKVPEAATQVRVFVGEGTRRDGETKEEFSARQQRVRVLERTLTLEHEYLVSIPFGANQASADIDVTSAVTATVTTTPPVKVVYVPNRPLSAHSVVDGRLVIGGITKGESTLALLSQRGELIPILIPASRVNQDLGNVQLPSAERNATIRIRTTNPSKQIPRRSKQLIFGVTLVSSAGDRVYTFLGNAESGWALKDGTGSHDLMVAAGDYWVVPQSFSSLGTIHFDVIQKVRAGVDLATAGVPRVAAVAGQVSSLELDAAAAEAAIQATPARPRE